VYCTNPLRDDIYLSLATCTTGPLVIEQVFDSVVGDLYSNT